jgi:hypothetical protein
LNAVGSLDDLRSPAATPGSQSNPIAEPSEPAPPQSLGSTRAVESEPGPATFGLHQQ